MTSRHLRSASLAPVNRTNPVLLLTMLLYATAIWEFFQVFLLMPVSPLSTSVLGFLLSGLQAVAANRIWNFSKKGALLAAAILAVRFAVLALQSLYVLLLGTDWLTLAGMFASLIVGLLVVWLLLLSWGNMR